MNYFRRVAGWLLLGMGTVLAGVALLAMMGVTQLQIQFFGFDLDTRGERLVWIWSWGIGALAGFFLLRMSSASAPMRR